jgi:hypothetical protein
MTTDKKGFVGLRKKRPSKPDIEPELEEAILSKADDVPERAISKVENISPKTKPKLQDVLIKITEEHHKKLALLAEHLSNKGYAKVSQRSLASRRLEESIDELFKQEGLNI